MVLLAVLLVGFFCGPALAIKPQSPLDLTLFQSTLSNGSIEVSFEAMANTDLTSVDLSIDIDPSLSLVEGERQWTGTISVGEKKTLKVIVRSGTLLPVEITGKSIAHFSSGGLFVQQNRIVLNAGEPAPPAQLGDAPIRRKRDGRAFLEFRGK
jgi:hypothetical protein